MEAFVGAMESLEKEEEEEAEEERKKEKKRNRKKEKKKRKKKKEGRRMGVLLRGKEISAPLKEPQWFLNSVDEWLGNRN